MSGAQVAADRTPATFNQVLGHTTVEYLDRARAHPFVKWPGGKGQVIPEIVKQLPARFGDYWEPFVGGGSVFFSLDSRIRNAHLSDLNLDLTITYQVVRNRTEALIQTLAGHAERHSRKHYLAVREKDPQDPVELAARFIYLNKTCYNGLHRVNKQGKFNVPIGRHKNPKICDAKNLLAASQVLQEARVNRWSFERIAPKPGDLVYCDPPYDGGFTQYNAEAFGEEEQKRLRDMCIQWKASGVHVIASNSNTPLIRSLYRKNRGGG